MAVAYESDGGTVFAASASNNQITVPLPATRPVGSVLLLIAWSRLRTDAISGSFGGVFDPLAGFPVSSGTASGGKIWVYARIVDGTETAPTVGMTSAVTGNSGDLWGACIVCYSGIETSGGGAGVLDGTPTVTDASGTTACTYPALTISNADSMVVRFLARFRDAADTFTPTATWNEREDLGSTLRTGAQFHLQDKLSTASGSQASVTVAPSNTTAARYLAVTLALKKPALLQPVADTLALADSCSPVLTPAVPPTGYPAAVLADSPAAYYRLGEASGLPQDSSGNGSHLVNAVGALTYAQSGATTDGDTAIKFPGSAGNRVTLYPVPASLLVGDTFTLEAWIKRAAIDGQYHHIVTVSGGNSGGIRITNGNRLQLTKAGVADVVDSTTTITDTTSWHHVVCTKNGSTVKLYIDGTDVTGTVTNQTCTNGSVDLFIGCDHGLSWALNGTLDEIAIYPTALSAARVSAHYAAATAAPPLEQDVDDALAVADSLSTQAVFQLTIPDTLALADAAPTFQRNIALAIPDTLAIADLASAQRGIVQAIPDTLAIADLATTAAGKGVSIPDTLALADTTSSAAVFQRTLPDTLALADAQALALGWSLTIPDTLALTDALAQAEEIHLGDTLALADLADPVKTVGGVAHSQPVADTLALADLLASASVFQRAVADTATPLDAQSFARGLTLLETLGLADSLGSQAVFQQAISDTLGLADLVATQRAIAQSIPDTLAVADAQAFQAALLRSLADTLALADSLTTSGAGAQSITDTLALADSLSTQAAFLRTLADTLALADLASPVKTVGGVAHSQPVADTLALADSLSTQAAFLRTVADTLALVDLATPEGVVGGADWTQPLADTLALADALVFQKTVVLSPADALPLADSLAFNRLLVLAELLALLDAASPKLRGPGIVLNLADAVYLGAEPADAVYAGSVKVWP